MADKTLSLLSLITLLVTACPQPSENCDNGIDDDADGLIDCEDELSCGFFRKCLDIPEACDNNIDDDKDGLTDCDDEDCAADSACEVEVVVCGDGIVSAGEECDDGNTTEGDGCSSECVDITGFELEPNNDAATANDFAVLSLNGKMFGSVNPVEEADVYAVVIPGADPVTLTAQTSDGVGGSTCVSNELDSLLRVLDASGTVLAQDDNAGAGSCSLVLAPNIAPGTYFVEVTASPNISLPAPFNYTLTIFF
jgi:cysteine-rich repeat protein